MSKEKKFKVGDKVKFPVINAGKAIEGAYFHGVVLELPDGDDISVTCMNKPALISIKNVEHE